MITAELIQEKITTKFGDKAQNFENTYGILNFETEANLNIEVLNFLRDEPTLGFTFLNDLTVVHFPTNKGREMEVVYLLQNMQEGIRLRYKVPLPIEKPEIETLSNLYSSANWQEREAYDFYGVIFLNHPNLIRIMNVDEMDYFPLRKEYPLEDQTRSDKDDDMFGRGGNTLLESKN